MQKSALKDSRLRRVSSVTRFKTVPEQSIVFNPKQFEVGQSKISRLPQRTMIRRNSQPSLPRTQKNLPKQQCKQLQLQLMISVNKKLSQENKQLKKELELYRKINKQRHNSCNSSTTSRDLKNLAIDKINRTKCSSRLVTDSAQTGLYSSKELSSYSQFESIKDMYDSFIKKAVKPTLKSFSEQLNKYFTEIQETYIKLRYLFQGIVIGSKAIREKAIHDQYKDCEQLLGSVNDICQLRIQRLKLPKYPGIQRKKSSKGKVQRAHTRQKDDQIELMSPKQVVEKFQNYTQKVMKIPKTMRILKSSLVITRFRNKLSQLC